MDSQKSIKGGIVMFALVEGKESKDQEVDEIGRGIVLDLRDYMHGALSGGTYKSIMKRAKRYIKNNHHYFE